MRRVIKIGGSLLHQPNLASSLSRWVRSQPVATNFAIVGGGELIDAIRSLDAICPGDPTEVHWKCVELLEVTFSWLGGQLEGWERVRGKKAFDDLVSRRQPPCPVDNDSEVGGATPRHYLIDVGAFYFRGCGATLPDNWATTTDAIAGWLAIQLLADELVIFKSCDVDQGVELSTLAKEGVIDDALSMLQADLPPTRFVNLAAGPQ